MPDAGKLDEPRRSEALRGVCTDRHRHDLIVAPVHDERRHPHGRQHLPDVDLFVHPVQPLQHPGASAVPDEVDERLDLVVVLHAKRAHRLPGLGSQGEDLERPIGFVLVGLFAAAPGKVWGPQCPRRAAADDQRRCPLGVGRGKQDAHRRALRQAIERRPPRPHRIHHRTDIVHARLQVRSAAHRIGHAGAPLVEPDQPGERSQTSEEPLHAGQPPLQLHVSDETRHEDKIEWPITNHLIGNVNIAAQRITCLRPHPRILAHGHGRSDRHPSSMDPRERCPATEDRRRR